MQEKYLFKIKKEGKIFLYSKKEFEDLMEITYLPNLRFDSVKILNKVKKICISAEKEGYLTKENIWFGAYYEKEIKSHSIPDLYIKWIDNIKEFGIFANKDFKIRSFLGEYTGNVRKYKKIIKELQQKPLGILLITFIFYSKIGDKRFFSKSFYLQEKLDYETLYKHIQFVYDLFSGKIEIQRDTESQIQYQVDEEKEIQLTISYFYQ